MRFAPKTTYRSGGSQEVNVYNVRNDNYYITARYELIKVKNKLLGMHYMARTKCFWFLTKRSTGVSTVRFIFKAICCVIFRLRFKNNTAEIANHIYIYIYLKKSINCSRGTNFLSQTTFICFYIQCYLQVQKHINVNT